jgi:ribosomal protein L3 glutamine methyltransferase
MVAQPADYRWSSYLANGLGRMSELHTPHAVYLALGPDEPTRLAAYRGLFHARVASGFVETIRNATNKGLALCDDVARHRLRSRVNLYHADLFAPDRRRRYDVIVSNPPYVRSGAIRRFPREYRHEPRMALAGGRDGLEVVRRILAGASSRLRRNGILVVEVGGGRRALERAFPRLPFVWVDLLRGGEGVFVLTRQELASAGL